MDKVFIGHQSDNVQRLATFENKQGKHIDIVISYECFKTMRDNGVLFLLGQELDRIIGNYYCIYRMSGTRAFR